MILAHTCSLPKLDDESELASMKAKALTTVDDHAWRRGHLKPRSNAFELRNSRYDIWKKETITKFHKD